MKAFDFSVPTRVFFGNGELRRKWHEKPGTGNDSTMARYAIMVTNNENYSILLKIGGLSRFKFN
jgi:alcohol dehydrogenase YqhD (iron-dependent ADH family)